MAYVKVPMTVGSGNLADRAVAVLVDRWLGWEANDGDMEIIQIETLAPMAGDAAAVASVVPDAVFRQYGLQMLGIGYLQGSPASGQAVITAFDNAGYVSEVPVEFSVEGVGFTTDEVVNVPIGETTVTVAISSMVTGLEGNDLEGAGIQLSSFPWIDTILVSPPTTGGANPEDDLAYQERLTERLKLQSTTLVTGRDFEIMALEVMAGHGGGRATAIVNNARAVTVALTDVDGEPVSPAIKEEVAALYEDYRQVNTTYTIIDPTYTTVNATFKIAVRPGWIAAEVLAEAQQALSDWLSPANWGQSPNYPAVSAWVNETVVRINEVIRVVSVAGVRYVAEAKINGAVADLTLPGVVPLPRPGTIAGTLV